MKFNRAKGKVLHLCWDDHQYQYRLGDEWIESSPAGKDLGILVDEKLNTSRLCAHSQESQSYPGLHQMKCGQQVEGGDSRPLLRFHETPPGVLNPALEPSAQERHGAVGASPEKGNKNDHRA